MLVLGGTKFLGRAFVEIALAHGHELTLFNRGETNPDLFPDVEKLRGDRGGDLSQLTGRHFDSVVDPSGYVPAVVRSSAEALGHCTHYLFVSSVSVYEDFSVGPNEESAVAALGDAPAHTLADDYSNYGALKALCEQAVWSVFKERTLCIRPGLIVGPHDPTGRFTYWAHRLQRGGEILAPGPPERRAQFIDVRDLADWMVRCVEHRVTGVFNATSTGTPWGELLAGADVTWVTDEFLAEHEVGPWMELPLWLRGPDFAGMHQTEVGRAIANGLRFRSSQETLAGAAEAPAVEGVGLAPEREQELLAAWHGR
ncbi:MAG TPA: NAD-dependent epimerase/dehydratase family protein [Gaiellaceae bacterium]|nr:NAD-dependent epimerase/dehydratase family protein [Gaiellaceae bacterium]